MHDGVVFLVLSILLELDPCEDNYRGQAKTMLKTYPLLSLNVPRDVMLVRVRDLCAARSRRRASRRVAGTGSPSGTDPIPSDSSAGPLAT